MNSKKSGKEENTEFTDLESQSQPNQSDSASEETDSAPSPYSVSSAFGSLFDTTKKVAAFGFQTACDVTNATINRFRRNDSNVVAENTSDSNSEQKVHTTTVTAVAIQEPIVLTAERVERVESNDRSITRQKSWIDERVSQRNIRREQGLGPRRDEFFLIYFVIFAFIALAAFLVYGLVMTAQDLGSDNVVDKFNLLPNMLALILLVFIQICVIGTALWNVPADEVQDGDGEAHNFELYGSLFGCIYFVNYVYGWVIVSLVVDSANPSVCDPNIYLMAKLVIIVIQVVQSLWLVVACFYLMAMFAALAAWLLCLEVFEKCGRDFCNGLCPQCCRQQE